MKICHVTYDDLDNPWLGGGGAVRAREIYRRLAERHEITLITGTYPGADRETWIDGLRLLRVGMATSYGISRASFCGSAIRRLKQLQWDVWVHEFSAFAPLFVPRGLRRRGVLLFQHFMGFEAVRKHALAGLASVVAERRVLKAYQRIITVSPSVQRKLQSRLSDRETKVHCVHNGVDARLFAAAPSDRGSYILSFGRLDLRTKGLDLLIEAFSRVAADNPEISLVIAGRGTDEQLSELEHRAGKAGVGARVILRASVDEKEKAELLSRALFLCMPSRYEGWGIAAIEASATGTAVLASHIDGLRDAVCDGETGLLVPTEDADALAQGMRRLLDDPALRRRLGTAGRDRAKRFDWDDIALEQEGLLEQAAAEIERAGYRCRS